ncbi:hypothetical protein J6590_001572 [Homalodisca vitripennis]|nr:hypothetical protein J6590_001572 [Homalodisca vitripennis]
MALCRCHAARPVPSDRNGMDYRRDRCMIRFISSHPDYLAGFYTFLQASPTLSTGCF